MRDERACPGDGPAMSVAMHETELVRTCIRAALSLRCLSSVSFRQALRDMAGAPPILP
jgi:hypothetical protein